jgi:hypothetical protein
MMFISFIYIFLSIPPQFHGGIMKLFKNKNLRNRIIKNGVTVLPPHSLLVRKTQLRLNSLLYLRQGPVCAATKS